MPQERGLIELQLGAQSLKVVQLRLQTDWNRLDCPCRLAASPLIVVDETERIS